MDGTGDQENYVDWIRRATHEAEQIRKDIHMPDWAEEVHRRVFRWAGHTARRHDGRGTREILSWSASGRRRRGRPLSRWSDHLNKFFQQARGDSGTITENNVFWMALAEDRQGWTSLEEDYVNFATRK